MKRLSVALLLPAILGAAPPPPSSDAGETIRISRTGVPCAGFCTIYDLKVTPDGLVWGLVVREKIRFREDIPIERVWLVVTSAQAARFRAILRAYRPTRIRPAHDGCARESEAQLSLPASSYRDRTAVEIDWLGLGPPQSVVTCDYDPNGFAAVVDQALRVLGLDSNGQQIKTAP